MVGLYNSSGLITGAMLSNTKIRAYYKKAYKIVNPTDSMLIMTSYFIVIIIGVRVILADIIWAALIMSRANTGRLKGPKFPKP